MNVKHALIFVSVLLHLLTLVIPGAALLGTLVLGSFAGGPSQAGMLPVVAAPFMIVYSVCTFASLAAARAGQGQPRRLAIAIGYTLSGLLLIAAAGAAVVSGDGLVLWIYGTTATATALAFLAIHGLAARTGVCEHCGYDRTGLPGDACPECGNVHWAGRCSGCGYDLAGFSGDVCPECRPADKDEST